MAKFKPMELIGEMHGKFSGKSEYYAAERYGTQYTGKIGENTTPPTPAQTQTRQNVKRSVVSRFYTRFLNKKDGR